MIEQDSALLQRIQDLSSDLERCQRELRQARECGEGELRPWFNLIRRLRSAAQPSSERRTGYAVIRVVVLCNELGEPKHWLVPEARWVEPSGRRGPMEQWLREMGQ